MIYYLMNDIETSSKFINFRSYLVISFAIEEITCNYVTHINVRNISYTNSIKLLNYSIEMELQVITYLSSIYKL